MTTTSPYVPVFPARSHFLSVRGLRYHLWCWGKPEDATAEAPLLVLAHGWMDVGASFQFMVDALRRQPGWATRPIVALDWRGFGQTEAPPGADHFYFVDYLGDLDAVLDQLSPHLPVDLLGHSMGGNVVMMYAGVRPARVRRLVNLEGFGLPAGSPAEAPERLGRWLDALKAPASLKDYASPAEVAQRLQANNLHLPDDRALWLAEQWARPQGDRWAIQADAAHRRPHPYVYRAEEAIALMAQIRCPVLGVEGAETLYFHFHSKPYTRDEFLARVAHVPDWRLVTLPDAGHMLHHDQPQALAACLAGFLTPAGA